MTEEIKDYRKPYFCNVAFDFRKTGIVPVNARDKAHAEALVLEMLAEQKNVKVLDVYAEDELPQEPKKEIPSNSTMAALAPSTKDDPSNG